jgi:hypothetical protein
MIGVSLKRASVPSPSWQRRRIPALAGLGLAALAVTACGSAGASSGSTAVPAASASPTPATAPAAAPGAAGTVAAVSGSTMEVQNPASGQVTVTFTSSTPITETVTAAAKDVTVGSCVTVVGQPPASGAAARTVTATIVIVSSPVNGNCTGGFRFGGGPRGNFPPGARPTFSPRPRPSGSRGAFGPGAFGGASGKVTSLSASGFVVQGRSRGANASGAPASPAAGAVTSTTVTISAATTYQKEVSARPSALKVGECVTAIGMANSIGAVAARTIRITQPGPNGCATGFGGRGGFGGGPGGGATNA